MKLRHAGMLVLASWYLIRPPLPQLNAHVSKMNTAASLSRWAVVRMFPTQEGCETRRGGNPWELCVGSHDPRFFAGPGR